MTDFATLVLAADARSLKAGEQALNSIAATSEKTERVVTKSNDNVAKSFKQVGDSAAANSQRTRMMAMQLSQVAQQASATGNWVQALAIQLPDLTLGFGTIGIAAGVVAGALLPLIVNLISSGAEAEKLKDIFNDLESATKAYQEATDNANQSAGDLVAQFGNQAQEAGNLYEAMRKIAELDFLTSIDKAREGIEGTLSGLRETIDAFQVSTSLPDFLRPEAIAQVRTQTAYLANEFGLTVVQADRVNTALDALAEADGPAQIAEAAMQLGDELSKAVDEGAKLSPEMREVQRGAYEASRDALRFGQLIGESIGVTNSLAGAMSGVADQAQRAASFAAALTARYPSQGAYAGVERSADGPIQGSGVMLPETGPTPTPRGTPELSGFPWEKFGSGRGGGGRGRKGGGKSEAENYDSIVEAANRRIASLKAEYEAIGMTEEAAEKLRQETDLFNDAQQKGITLTDAQRANLSTLAETMANVEQQTKAAKEQQDFFNDISDDLKDGFIDSIVEGEKLSDTFKDIGKSIAKAALEAALFGSGPFAGGAGGGGGFLGGIFKLFSFDGGGSTGPGSRSGGVDGKGGFPALLHPNETVIDHTKGGGAGQLASKIEVVSRFDANGNFESNVERISQRVSGDAVQRGIGQYDKGFENRLNQAMERTG